MPPASELVWFSMTLSSVHIVRAGRTFSRLSHRLLSNYWFVPALVIAGCFGLAYLMVALDSFLPTEYVVHLSWVYARDPDGARTLLSVISQSMITVAGVVFSITVVALTMASSQFGTRVLKSFTRDSGNQFVLGTFLGTFLYGVVVMRRVERNFVPSLSVAVGIFLAIANVVVLVYFIHHVITEIQAENVVAAVARDLYATMDVLFPEEIGESGPMRPDELRASEASQMDGAAIEVPSRREGFVHTVDSDKLLRLARNRCAVIRLLVLPGDFISKNTLVARAWCDDGMSKDLTSRLEQAISVGKQRTYDDDIGFGLQQLALIAVRSLSSAMNALGTASDAIDRLIAGLVRLGCRDIPSAYRRDDEGQLRVITPPWNLEQLLDSVLDPIRQAAVGNPPITMQILRGLGDAETKVRNPDFRQLLRQHMDRFADVANTFPQQLDRHRAHELYESVRQRRIL